MIVTTAKLLHSAILKIFLALSLVFIILFFFLTSGVSIPNISLPGLKITQFYIKLDKKLSISIDTIKIEKQNRPAGTIKEIDRIGKVVQYLPNYFHKVVINNLIVGKRVFHLLYNDDVFYFDSDTFELISKLSYDPESKALAADIRKLYIKNPQAELSGYITYDFRNRIWRGRGNYGAFGIHGKFKISHVNDYFSFELDSKPCRSIKELVDYINPPEQIKVWIYPKIPAKKYILHYLKGGFILKSDGSLDFDPRELRAFATAYDAKIHFHPEVPPVSTPQIDITLKNDVLAFKLYKPVYEGKRLDGSYVKIRNLTNSKAELDAHIVVKDKIDESIRKILNAYGIYLPFVQTEGVTEAVVDFTVRLAEGEVTKYRGTYTSEYAKLLFDNVIPLPVKNLHVISEGSKISILPCKIGFDPYLDADLTGSIDLHKKIGEFRPVINRLSYRYSGIPLIQMNDIQTPLLLDFKKDVTFTFPDMKMKIVYKQGGGAEAEAKRLDLLKQYFKGPLEPIQRGRIHVLYQNGKLHAEAKILYPNKIFATAAKPVENFDIKLDRADGELHVKINDKISLTTRQRLSFFRVKKIDIDVGRLLQSIEPYLSRIKKQSKEHSPSSRVFNIEGYDSRLFYKKLQLPCTFYNFKIYPDPFGIKFETRHGKGKIRGIVENGKINVAGKNLSDNIIRGLTTLDQLKGGSFDFNAKGEIEDFSGTVLMRNTLWAKTALYNNLLATLNTIPAILTLKNPGFSKNGFKIKRGALDYRFKNEKLFFKKIVVEGYSAQITGKGAVNLKNETIALRLQIHFLESLTNILNKIPVAGYLIFGKDGTLAVTLNVKGPIENPKITTEATKDLIKAPLNILERTLTLPFKIFK